MLRKVQLGEVNLKEIFILSVQQNKLLHMKCPSIHPTSLYELRRALGMKKPFTNKTVVIC